MQGNALVLGGGGVTGVAWETGLLTGLLEQGIELSKADVVIGTSAGAAVAAQITSGVALPELYARQLAGASAEIPVSLGAITLVRYVWAMLREKDTQRFGMRMGRLALASKTIAEAERRVAIASRLPRTDWPQRDVKLTAVNAVTGEFRVFDRDSKVELIDAVCASCAVPGVWPPVTLGADRWIDGGMHSACNASLASGRARVVILAPIPTGFGVLPSVAKEAAQLRSEGSSVVVLSPDAQARRAMGRNSLDPSRRPVSAREGHRQAAAAAAEVSKVWA
jgi:NTE family protein